MKNRVVSILLIVSMLVSCMIVSSFSTVAVNVETQPTSANSTKALSHIQGSAILHCFDWSYNSIKSNMKAIADAGYTAVQTSPVQPPKDYSPTWLDQGGQWWKIYQPIGIRIADGNHWLGTKSELKAMCAEAEKYGVKVVVDIVANHLADQGKYCNGLDNVSTQVDGDLRRGDYWHSDMMSADDDGNRYKVTHGAIGLPDLNTGHGDIQQKFKSLLIDCVNCGVDGFRFDAAKHIELPGEDGGSDFWPTILGGATGVKKDTYFYGEILNYAGTSINNYTRYMSVTDNEASDYRLSCANNGNASGLASNGAGSSKQGLDAAHSVLWCESHDTYMGDSGIMIKNTKNISNATIVKCWAIIGSRAQASALFFARPAANMGDASTDTTWKSKAVAEVNKFKNYFDGESEYLSSQGDCAYNERGTSGVVISKLGGGGSVSLKANKMKDGTYKDWVSGGTFTVSGGQIKGNVDSSGVAVVYNAAPAGPSVSISFNGSDDGGSFQGTAQVTLNASETASQTYKLGSAAAVSYTNGKVITIGADMNDGDSVKLVLEGKGKTGANVTKTYTFTKKAAPTIPGVTTLYFDNSSSKWSSVYAYAYKDETTNNGQWPGAQMKKLDDSIYGIAVDENWSSGYVIFSNNGADQTDRTGHAFKKGDSKIYVGGTWKDYVKSSGTVATGLYGDANGDSKVNIKDATAIQKHIADIEKLSAEKLARCDVNSDKSVNIKDCTCIQSYIAGLTANAKNAGKPISGTTTVVTTPTETPTETNSTVTNGKYVYFKNNSNWSDVNAYFWGESDLMSWPGNPMQSIGGNVFKAEIPSGATMVIFNNGSDKTGDLTIEGENKIFDNGWTNYIG